MYTYDYTQLCEYRGRGLMQSLREAHTIHKDLPDAKFTKSFEYVVDQNKRRTKLRVFDGTGDPAMDYVSRDEGKDGKKRGNGQVLDSYAHWDPFFLRISAEEGCPLCWAVWRRLQPTLEENTERRKAKVNVESDDGDGDGEDRSVGKYEGYEWLGGRVQILEYWQVDGEKKTVPLIFHFAGIPPLKEGEEMVVKEITRITINLEKLGSVLVGNGIVTKDIEGGEHIPEKSRSKEDSGSTWSPDAIAQLENWLHSCEEDHGCKTTRSDERFLPGRLLYVGSQETQRIRLVESYELPANTQYATLSHCWGDASLPRPYLLLQRTLDAMLRDVEPQNMPTTFSESITVLRQLKIEYIWIDSLCIIQDSKEDWQRHASLMYKIYSHSYLNISATASSSPDQGLFRDRHPNSVSSGVVEVPEGHDFLEKGNWQFYDETCFKEEVDEAPVNKRAWVVQERLLSPRIVHFSEGQLYWECGRLQASERCPSGFPERMTRSTQRDTYKAACKKDVDTKVFLGAWDELVNLYTTCGLTYKSDKMAAVSALAKNIQAETGWEGEYLAGLWQTQLVNQLLWVAGPGARRMRKEDSKAPSWSWMSMDGPLQANFNCFSGPHRAFPYNVDYSRHIAQVLEAKTEIDDGGDPFLSVSGGRLRLRAPVWCVSLAKPDTELKLTVARKFKLSLGANLSERGSMHTDDETDYEMLSKMVLYFVPIICWPGVSRRTGLEDGELERLSGVVLTREKKEPSITGGAAKEGVVFRRVGVVAMGEDLAVELLSELGNQEISQDGRLQCLTKSDERLEKQDFAPSNWFLMDLPSVPRDYALYDLDIE